VNETEDLIEKIESIQNMLVARATGSFPNEREFAELRQEVVNNDRVKDLLPRFLRTSRSLDQFWGYIGQKYGKYAERRNHIWEGFAEVLEALENNYTSPADSGVTDALERFDSESVHQLWSKALERRQNDPEGAITLARTLLESVCKQIIEEQGVAIKGNPDLPKLYSSAATALNIAPSQHSEKLFKRILGGCTSVVEGLGALRNELSDAHGKGKMSVKPAPRHAELAVNLAGSMATFLIATHEARNET
jgi:hypothetical protein